MTETPGADWLQSLAQAARQASERMSMLSETAEPALDSALDLANRQSRARFRHCPTWHQYVAPLPVLAGDVP